MTLAVPDRSQKAGDALDLAGLAARGERQKAPERRHTSEGCCGRPRAVLLKASKYHEKTLVDEMPAVGAMGARSVTSQVQTSSC